MGEPKFRKSLRQRKVDLKFERIRNLWPEGRLHPIWGTGPAECAGRAAALEFVKKVDVHLARFVPREGGGFN